MSGSEMRVLQDRRARPTPILSRYVVYGRRGSFRRESDQKKGGYVDRYGADVFFLLMLILILNVLDALSTMVILNLGGSEINPIVNYGITFMGDRLWIFKIVFVSVLVVLLCLHSNFRFARAGMIGLSVIFMMVTLYHFSIIMRFSR